jgi:hypothetical protein
MNSFSFAKLEPYIASMINSTPRLGGKVHERFMVTFRHEENNPAFDKIARTDDAV